MNATLPSKLPFFLSSVKAGFPSPADDFIDTGLDLNQHLILHPEATFLVRVSGNSMINAGIFDGDTLIVDRALTAFNGNIVVAVINNDFTVKRLATLGGRVSLRPENPEFKEIIIHDDEELQIWGVVTYVLHKCTP